MVYMWQTDIGHPLPLHYPGGTKAPRPTGYSGYAEREPSRETVEEWALRWPTADIGLRLAPDVVGIDLDLYQKAGRRTIAALQARWGTLPPTWKTTSRLDGSGIWLYMLPTGEDSRTYRDPKGPGYGGVEVIRRSHRFITVYPSHHPRQGRPPYKWVGPDGTLYTDTIPERADLATLPARWCTGLASGAVGASTRATADPDVHAWLRARPGGDGEPCRAMARVLAEAVAEVRRGSADGGCHSAARDGIWQLVGNAAEGCRGAHTALVELGRVYVAEMRRNGRRSVQQARHEFRAALVKAIAKRSIYPLSDDDTCTMKIKGIRRA